MSPNFARKGLTTLVGLHFQLFALVGRLVLTVWLYVMALDSFFLLLMLSIYDEEEGGGRRILSDHDVCDDDDSVMIPVMMYMMTLTRQR